MGVYVYVCQVLCGVIAVTTVSTGQHNHVDIHGGVPMGVKTKGCDNGKWRLDVDWDDRTNYEYQCQPNEDIRSNTYFMKSTECLNKKNIPPPLHKCMTERIMYEDTPPMAGSHRPIWPVYGEYLYIPPQRWVHALEHGAAVFLYHPCAEPYEIERLRRVATNCLRRHIITPYRELKPGYPFAVITYGCRLQMTKVDEETVKSFVKGHALRAPEWRVYKDGSYNHALRHKAEIVYDREDTRLCPVGGRRRERMLMAETMDTLLKH